MKKLFMFGVVAGLLALLVSVALACGDDEKRDPWYARDLQYLREADYALSVSNAEDAYYLLLYAREKLDDLGVSDDELVQLEALARIYAIEAAEEALEDFRFDRENGSSDWMRYSAEDFASYIEFLGAEPSDFGVTPEEEEIMSGIRESMPENEAHAEAHVLAADLQNGYLFCGEFRERTGQLYFIFVSYPGILAHFAEEVDTQEHISPTYMDLKETLLCSSS